MEYFSGGKRTQGYSVLSLVGTKDERWFKKLFEDVFI